MKFAARLWIQEFSYEIIQNRVRIAFTSNPDQGTIDHEVVVPKITEFRMERYHKSDAISLGDYHGCKITCLGTSWRYELDTGDAKVEFEAQEKVTL